MAKYRSKKWQSPDGKKWIKICQRGEEYAIRFGDLKAKRGGVPRWSEWLEYDTPTDALLETFLLVTGYHGANFKYTAEQWEQGWLRPLGQDEIAEVFLKYQSHLSQLEEDASGVLINKSYR